MDFLGIGPLELVAVLVIALIVLGPRDIASFARRAGGMINRLYRSEVWGAVNKASREFRDLPNRLAREAALEELDESLRKVTEPGAEKQVNPALDAWTPSPKSPGEPEPPAEESASPAPEPPDSEAADA
jgi:Sec-independent protein translocase protein TatA